MSQVESPNYSKAKEEAKKLLDEFGVHEPIVPVFDIAKSRGLKIHFVDMPEEMKDVSGFFDPKTKSIYVNKQDPPNRRVFTVAHELGHYVLGHEPKEYSVLYRWISMNTKKDNLEQEANCFAANLLVPKDMLLDISKKYSLDKDQSEILSKMFGVSRDVVKYRLLHP